MERDPLSSQWQNQPVHFNSHAHVERDAECKSGYTAWDDFNSHAHVERDLSQISANISKWHFNSHAHVERDAISFDFLYIFNNFNSHAHVERDLAKRLTDREELISTHTLTWSVTKSDCARYSSLLFQLTRSRGA